MTRIDTEFLKTLSDMRFKVKGEERGLPTGKILAMLVRPSFIAPAGRTLVWGDWSAIEARVLPWLAASPGADKVLDIFRASDADKTKPDIYMATACMLTGDNPDEMWRAIKDKGHPQHEYAKMLRQAQGKVPVLSLGYGGGLGALQAMAVNYGVFFDDERGKWVVDTWRATNAWARQFWGRHDKDGSSGLWGAVNMAVEHPGTAFEAGRVAFVFDKSYLDGSLICALPCGRLLTWPDLKWRTRSFKDKKTGESVEKTAFWYKKGYGHSALWHGKVCLAADTNVLTPRGWVPIVDVKTDDHLWDGGAWVKHDGLIYQGEKFTIPVDGVHMTPDHKVLTDDGWKDAEISHEFNRAAVRLPDGFGPGEDTGAWSPRVLGGALPLWHGSRVSQRRLGPSEQEAFTPIVRLRDLWSYRQRAERARHEPAPCVCGVVLHVGALRPTFSSGLAALRRAWDSSVCFVASVLRSLLGRHGPFVSEGLVVGAAGQRPRVQPEQLLLGDKASAGPEQAQQPLDRHAMGPHYSGRGQQSIWRQADDTSLSSEQERITLASIRAAGRAEQVFDLMNAGPQRRFTVLGYAGPMLVHNCENITQATAGSILRETLVAMDEAAEVRLGHWMTVGHTHDEIVDECDDDPDTVDACKASMRHWMQDWRPEWRADLPLVAEITENFYYTKALD